MLAIEYPIWPLHLRAKELTIFRYARFGSWRRGAWAWAVVAGRWARRHAAPAVVGRFIFFATWPFLAIQNARVLGFTTDDGRRTTKPGYPQTPLLLTENRQNLSPKNFFGDFKYQETKKGKGKGNRSAPRF